MNDERRSTPAFTWRAHPARERVGRAALGGAIVLALAAACGLLMQDAWWAVLASAVLVLALNRFYFPSRFLIDDEGILARYPLRRLRRSWPEIRRFLHDENGGYLSPRVKATRWDGFGGMHVLFGTERESVIERITAHLKGGGASCPD